MGDALACAIEAMARHTRESMRVPELQQSWPRRCLLDVVQRMPLAIQIPSSVWTESWAGTDGGAPKGIKG